MATSNGQIAATTTKSTTVNTSLWFDSYSLLLTDLEHLSPSSDIPPSMVEKLKETHAWFLNTVNQFKPPCESSKNALNAEHVVVDSRKLSIKPQLKDLALKLSSTMLLDEVQSYILVERSVDHSALDGINQGFLNERYPVIMARCLRFLDDFSALPIFYQAMLSSNTKPIPVVEALASLMSYSRYPAIQLRAAEAFSMLCSIADRLQSYMSGNTNLSLGGKQVIHLKRSIKTIIGEQSEKNEELYVSMLQ